MSETAAGPIEVLDRRRQVLIDRDMDGFADLFAPDGVIEIPFAKAGMPSRLAGRETIREFATRGVRDDLQILDLRVDQAYRTEDPEVVVLELTSVGRVAATGAPFEVPCVQIFRIRDGEIVLFRDYVGTAFLPDLTAGVESGARATAATGP